METYDRQIYHAPTIVVDTPDGDTLDPSTKDVPRFFVQAYRIDIVGAYTLTGRSKLWAIAPQSRYEILIHARETRGKILPTDLPRSAGNSRASYTI